MRSAAVSFVLSMLSAALLTPLIREQALRMGAVDHALSSRKIHGRPIPRLGGLAIAGAFYAPLLGLIVFQSSVGALFLAQQKLAIGLILGGTAIVLRREAASPRRAGALLAASAGVTLVLLGAGTGAIDGVGAAMGFGAAVTYTAYILVADGPLAGIPPLVLSALGTLLRHAPFLA